MPIIYNFKQCHWHAVCIDKSHDVIYCGHYILPINGEWSDHREISERGLGVCQYVKAEVWDFPVMTEWTRLISYLLYGLFVMDLSLRSIKTNNWSVDNFKKKTHHLSEVHTCTIRWHWSADTLFDSCQLTITWMSTRMSTIKLNIDCIQLFRERLSEKMCMGQSRKVIWDMINTLFLTTVAVEPTFVAFL